jgi:hypothetical protein
LAIFLKDYRKKWQEIIIKSLDLLDFLLGNSLLFVLTKINTKKNPSAPSRSMVDKSAKIRLHIKFGELHQKSFWPKLYLRHQYI